jgi:HlyD family secretion protein
MPLANPTPEDRVAEAEPPRVREGVPADLEDARPPFRPGKLVALSAVILLLLALAIWLRHKPAPPRNTVAPAAYNSEAAPFLRLKGTTEAIQSRSILAPTLSGQQVGTLTITRLLPSGARIQRGDLLVEFDRQAQLRDFLDKQAEYTKLVDQVAEEQAKESAARAKDETELHQADSDLKSAALDMQKVELLSRIDVEKAQQTLEQANATLTQLKETFDLKRRAAQAAIRILEIQRDRTRRIMENSQSNSERMQIHSPLDGAVVLDPIRKNGRPGEAQEGDQVRPGVAFMHVVDPSAMQVRVLVNQQDILSLQPGQAARVHLDAYPDLVLPGKLEQIAPIARNGDFSQTVRTFAVVFSIQGNDPRLMPDLSAAVDLPQETAAKPGGARP